MLIMSTDVTGALDCGRPIDLQYGRDRFHLLSTIRRGAQRAAHGEERNQCAYGCSTCEIEVRGSNLAGGLARTQVCMKATTSTSIAEVTYTGRADGPQVCRKRPRKIDLELGPLGAIIINQLVA